MDNTTPLTFRHFLPSGQGGASPSTVADAMVGAITDFVKKKQPKYVSSVKIVIFQKEMLSDFHNSMMKVQGEAVKSKGVIGTIKGITLYHTHFITPNLTFLSCSGQNCYQMLSLHFLELARINLPRRPWFFRRKSLSLQCLSCAVKTRR